MNENEYQDIPSVDTYEIPSGFRYLICILTSVTRVIIVFTISGEIRNVELETFQVRTSIIFYNIIHY